MVVIFIGSRFQFTFPDRKLALLLLDLFNKFLSLDLSFSIDVIHIFLG
jgi:hypothetical protein